MPQLHFAALALWGTIIVAFIAFRLSSPAETTCTQTPDPAKPDPPHAGYLDHERTGEPHHGSWRSWWHPQRSSSQHGQGAGTRTKDWNILYHLGGNGPWIEKAVDVVDGGIGIPEGCAVEQVHMMSRHAERFPTVKAGTSAFNWILFNVDWRCLRVEKE